MQVTNQTAIEATMKDRLSIVSIFARDALAVELNAADVTPMMIRIK